MPASFSIHGSLADGVARIAFDGDVDLATLPAIRDIVNPYLSDESCRELVIDLSTTTFIDSSGLGELVATRKHADKAGKGFAITGAQGTVARIIALTGLDAYLLGGPTIE